MVCENYKINDISGLTQQKTLSLLNLPENIWYGHIFKNLNHLDLKNLHQSLLNFSGRKILPDNRIKSWLETYLWVSFRKLNDTDLYETIWLAVVDGNYFILDLILE